MPKRKRSTYKKRTFKKRSYKRRRLRPRRLTTRMTKAPFGKKFRFKTRYVQLANQLNPGLAGTPVSYVFSLNSLYDPDRTGAGHQVLGFDQLMPMYDHYCVIAAKVTVTATNTDPTNSQIFGLQIKDIDTTSTDLSTQIENGLMTYKTLGTRDSGSATKTLTYGVNMSKFFGRKVLEGTKYTGTISTSPNDGCYCHVIAAPADGSSDTAVVYYNIQIDYIAMLTEPNVLAQS